MVFNHGGGGLNKGRLGEAGQHEVLLDVIVEVALAFLCFDAKDVFRLFHFSCCRDAASFF